MGYLETLAAAPAYFEVLDVTFQAAVLVAADAYFTDGEGSRHTPQGGVAQGLPEPLLEFGGQACMLVGVEGVGPLQRGDGGLDAKRQLASRNHAGCLSRFRSVKNMAILVPYQFSLGGRVIGEGKRGELRTAAYTYSTASRFGRLNAPHQSCDRV